MGMQLDRQPCGALHRRDQLRRLIRKQQPRHILDTDGIRAHVLDLFCNIGPVIQRISVAQRIGKGNLRMALFLVARLHCAL